MIGKHLQKAFLKATPKIHYNSLLKPTLHRYFSIIQSFRLPDLGEKIKEATIQKWHVKEGDIVAELDTLADVSTDKLFTPLPAPYGGKIHKIFVGEDKECEVGSVLVQIEISDETALELGMNADEQPASQTDQPEKKEEEKSTTTQQTETPKSGQQNTSKIYQELDQVLATPAVRGLAKTHNVDLRYVQGSQKNGRIIKDDIHLYLEGKTQPEQTGKKATRVNYETLEGQKPSPTELVTHTQVESLNVPHDANTPGMTVKTMTPLEVGMVKAMTYNTTVPQFYSMEEVLVEKLISWRKDLNKDRTKEDKLSIMPFFIKSFSMALKYFPRINSLYYPEKPYEYEVHGSHNISVAIDSKFGLIAPNIKNCENKSIMEIDQDLKRLRQLADAGQMGSNDLFGGTSAITNIGSIAGTYSGPVNLPNQVFISGLGKVKDEPAFVNPVKTEDGRTLYEIEMHSKLYLSCGCDHRVLDGATVARFLLKWKYFMENPDAWVLEMK